MNLSKFSLAKKRYFALSGNRDSTILAEIIRVSAAAQPIMQELATVDGCLDDKVTLNRLLSKTTDIKGGEISIALPLNFFELASVTMPKIKEEAVGRALPYHLAKVIDRPLSDYIYDWQITRRQKENIEVTAYLLPAKIYNVIKKDFSNRQLEIKYLEADVFAAFAYLGLCGRLNTTDTTVCALIWPQSLSLALYEGRQLKLVRNIKLPQPEEEFCLPTNLSNVNDLANPAPETISMPGDLSLEAEEDEKEEEPEKDLSTILADFSLLSKTAEEIETNGEIKEETIAPPMNLSLENALASPGELAWQDYLQEIILELIRTRDYYTSVAKGGQLGKIVIGGADFFWPELKELTETAINLPVELLIDEQIADNTPALLKAICIGTGSRW